MICRWTKTDLENRIIQSNLHEAIIKAVTVAVVNRGRFVKNSIEAPIYKSMRTYGNIAWRTKTMQQGIIRLLTGIRRLARLGITEAMCTTPAAVLEVLLDLPPLHIPIQGETLSSILV